MFIVGPWVFAAILGSARSFAFPDFNQAPAPMPLREVRPSRPPTNTGRPNSLATPTAAIVGRFFRASKVRHRWLSCGWPDP